MQYDAVEPTLDVEPPEPEEPIFEPESEQMPRQLDLFQEQGMEAVVPENAMHLEPEEPAYQIPSLSLLKRSNNTGKSPEIQQELERNKRMLEETLTNICKYFDFNWWKQNGNVYKAVPKKFFYIACCLLALMKEYSYSYRR